MKNVLITGGAGYIGSVLTETLLKVGYNVHVVDTFLENNSSLCHAATYEGFDCTRADVIDFDSIKNLVEKADVIIPLAALVGAPICSRHATIAEMLNYEAVKNIANMVTDEQLLIYPNTNSGYGVMDDGSDFCTEDSPLNPISIYGDTKVRAEDSVINKNGIAFRLATVFGSSYRMRIDLMVNDFVWRAHKDNSIVLFESHFRRNFIHIRDVCGAFLHGIKNMETMRGNVYNLGLSSANLTKLELCEKIKLYFPNLSIIQAEIGEDPDKRDYLVSNQKLERTGWKPAYSLDDGIIELKKYYRTFKPNVAGNV